MKQGERKIRPVKMLPAFKVLHSDLVALCQGEKGNTLLSNFTQEQLVISTVLLQVGLGHSVANMTCLFPAIPLASDEWV